MGQSWTFGRKIGLGFGLSVFILLVVGSVAYRSTDVLIENNANVAHSHLVMEDIAQLLSLMKDTETGQRGYVITGDDAYLEPYLAALALLSKDDNQPPKPDGGQRTATETSRRGGAADRSQARRAQTDHRHPRSQGFEPTQKVVQSNEGKKAMDDLRRVLGAMDQEERDLLRIRSEGAEASASSAKTTIGMGAVLAFVLVSAAGYVITRSLNQQLGAAISSIRSSSTELQAAATQQASGSREQVGNERGVDDDPRLLATSRNCGGCPAYGADSGADGGRGANGRRDRRRAQEAILTIKRQVDLIVGHMLAWQEVAQQPKLTQKSSTNCTSRPTSSPSMPQSKPLEPGRAK